MLDILQIFLIMVWFAYAILAGHHWYKGLTERKV